MDSVKKILERRSERSYKKQEIEKEKIDQLISVINSSPTSGNSHCFSAIIVDDIELRKTISLGLPTQQHIIDAPLFIIFCADLNRIEYVSNKTNNKIYTNTLNNFLSASGDAYIAASFAANAGLQLGLGSCYIGILRWNMEAIAKALNLSGSIVPIVGLTFGYIDHQNEIKPKINHVYKGKYDMKKIETEIQEYDDVMFKYYDSRNLNKKPNSKWSETCLSFFLKEGSDKPIDEFIKKTWKI